MKKYVLRSMIFCFILMSYQGAQAHSDTCGCNSAGVTNINGLRPFSGFGSSLYAGSVDIEDESFDYQVLELNYNLWATERLALQIGLPLARVKSDESAVYGLSDMALQGVYQLGKYNQGKTLIWASLGLEIPTGDQEKNLSSGHFDALSSFSIQHQWLEKLLVFGGAGFSRGLTSGHEEEHGEEEHEEEEEEEEHAHGIEGAVIAPHTESEINYHAGFTYVISEKVTATLQASGQTSVYKDVSGDTSFHATSSLNMRIAPKITASVFGALPFGNHKRFKWRSGIRLGFTL